MSTRMGVWVLAALAVLQVGCFGKGIRKLEAKELAYFEKLQGRLDEGQKPMVELLELTAEPDAAAVREVSSFNSRVGNAKRIYALREMLTAPEGNTAAFVQVTRNKVILYHLTEASQAENALVSAELDVAAAERKRLTELYAGLMDRTRQVVETQKTLHQYLDRSVPQQVADSLAEAGRQVRTFNEEIQKGDAENADVQALTRTGQQVQQRLEQVDEALGKFIELWPQLNKLKDKEK